MNQLGRIACGIWTPGWSIPDFLSVFFLFVSLFVLSKKKKKKTELFAHSPCSVSSCLRYIVEMFP